MNPLEKYKNIECTLETGKHYKVTAFGHLMNKQNGYIDQALMEGKKTLGDIKSFLKSQPDLDDKRRNPNDEKALNIRIIDHLRWLVGEDKHNGFKAQINKIVEYSPAKKLEIYAMVTSYVMPIYLQVKEDLK